MRMRNYFLLVSNSRKSGYSGCLLEPPWSQLLSLSKVARQQSMPNCNVCSQEAFSRSTIKVDRNFALEILPPWVASWNTAAFTCLLSRFVQALTVIWHRDLLSWCHFGTLGSALQTHTLNRWPLKQRGDQREWVYPVREACHWNWIRANWWYYSSGCTTGMV